MVEDLSKTLPPLPPGSTIGMLGNLDILESVHFLRAAQLELVFGERVLLLLLEIALSAVPFRRSASSAT